MADLVPIKQHAGPLQDEFRNVYKLISRIMSPLEGSGQPSDPALYVGQIYIDTSMDPPDVYIAVTAGRGAADWVPITTANMDNIETFTAGAGGQSIFNLSNFSYIPGTNQIMVFISSALARLTADYTETSSTRVTTTFTVPAGSKVVIYKR